MVTAPALSVAFTVSWWSPEGAFFQRYEYGAVVSSPSFVAPRKNSTLWTVPSVSVAVASMVMVGCQANVASLAGEVMLAVGGLFAEMTVIVLAALVVVAPRLSVARAVSV